MVTLVRVATDQDYRYELFDNKLFWASTGVFVLGLLSAVIGSSYAEDVGWMARKTMLLPLVVPLLMAFARKTNQTAALTGVVVGFWIAFVLTGNIYNWIWSGGRYEGATWDVGMWGVVNAMLVVLLTPFVSEKNIHLAWRFTLVLSILGAAMMLLVSGSRGPLLGAFIAVLLYLLLKSRIALILIACIATAGISAANHFGPQQVSSLLNRVQSISDVSHDGSNYIRLALWENGYALLKKQLMTGDRRFWFGNGHRGKSEEANNYFYSEFKDQPRIKPGAIEALHPNVADQHNMYLDSALSNGVLWTIACLILLGWLGFAKSKNASSGQRTWMALPMWAYFMVNGLTYSILPHFSFLIFLFFISLLRSMEEECSVESHST